MAKDPYFFIKEVTYSFKIIYVLAMLLVYFAVFNEMKNKMNWEKIVQRNISINIILISLVMLLAEITSTGNVSYGTPGKEGHSGWFYSPNDQSAVLAMGFGVLILYFLNKKNKNTKIFYAASILLAAWAMMTIGTKVALFSLLTLLGLGILISFLRMLMKKEKAFNLMILTFVLLLVIGITPLTAVGNNMNITYPEFESMTKELKPDTETPNVIEKPEKEKKPHFNDNVDLNYKVFSGRDDFLEIS